MNNFFKGALLSLISAFGFALLPIFALFAYQGHINVTTLLFIRFFFGALLFFSYVFIKYQKVTVQLKDLFYLFVLGGICYNLQSQFYFSAVKYISPSLAALLLYTYPMTVTILTFFIDKEKITKAVGASVGLSFIGLILILGMSLGKVRGLGILLALGAALVYSVYIIIGNRVVRRMPPLVMSAFIAAFSAIGQLVFGVLSGELNFNFASSIWLPVIGLILFSTVIAMLFFFKGMELIGPAKASIISMMEPVFTVVLSTIILKDHLTLLQLTGGVLVLAGAGWVVWSREHHHIPEMNNTI